MSRPLHQPLQPPGEGADPGGPRPSSVARTVRLDAPTADPRRLCWDLPVERPVALRCNGEDIAVVMATPEDLEDLALGFALSEELVGRAADVQGIESAEQPAGILLDLRVRPAALARQALRRRRFAARSGCGVCGVTSLEEAVRVAAPVKRGFRLDAAAVAAAFRRLPVHQPINSCNRSVHGAAWCRPDGGIELAREDVGRHNALDKLIGALARDGRDLSDGFVVLTSRCSFEMIQKAAAVGIPAVASLSAPTSLALELAWQAELQVAAHCSDGVVFFDPPQGNSRA